jgi:hypothetical protein
MMPTDISSAYHFSKSLIARDETCNSDLQRSEKDQPLSKPCSHVILRKATLGPSIGSSLRPEPQARSLSSNDV